jgi:hypothetical protein
MKKINSKKEVEKRNEKFLKEFLDLTLEEYFAKMRLAGKPKKFANGIWSDLNPTAGRCGSVIGALRISNKIPKGYIPCGQKEAEGGSHFYMINPITNEVIDPTAGHIPGAKNRWFKENLTANGLFKSADVLRAELTALIKSPDTTIMQCGSGASACVNLLAMEIAGLSGAALYPGSWSEWSADPARPIATGNA